jgi:peptide/nickel transport system substrate-binding protein
VAEAVVNDLNAAGIRVRLRSMERAAFYAAWQEKKLRGLFMTAAGNSGNAASRVETFMQSKGGYAYGGYPDIDDLFQQQASERDVERREALPEIQHQLTIERAMRADGHSAPERHRTARITRRYDTDVWMSPFSPLTRTWNSELGYAASLGRLIGPERLVRTFSCS